MSGEFQLDFGIDHPEAPTAFTAAVTQSETGAWPIVVIRVTGIEESEFGARMTADMLRDWADAIEARLPPSNPGSPQVAAGGRKLGKSTEAQAEYNRLMAARRPGETIRDVERRERLGRPHNASPLAPDPVRPSITEYQTPERVLKNREKRERRRFNPKKAE